MDVSSLHHNNYGGFYALRVGLFSAGKGSSGFSRFRYRNAVPREKDMSAYLMVFHKDEDHGLHMAISPDGYTFTALNEGKPVIAGDTIAEQKGIRDPHIFRGPDGAFYLSMTICIFMRSVTDIVIQNGNAMEKSTDGVTTGGWY